MNITVILCTYNRYESLAKTLDSLAALVVPETLEWKVLVVDNNSSDRTRAVVESFCQRYPGRFRYLFEPRQGKSHALNAGIHEATGEVLAFVDDDVIIAPTWLQNLTSPLQNTEWAGVGGRILPGRSFSPPSWLALSGPYAMGGVLCAHFDLGNEAKELDRPPYGTNMAIRRSMFDKHGYFRIDMGPRPGSEIRSEDTEFGRRLLAGKERLFYAPSAIVYHEVSENRLRREFFLTWWFDYGRAQIREDGMQPNVCGIPRHYLSIPKLIGTTLLVRVLRWMCSLNPQRRFFWKCYVWVTAGWMVEKPRVYREAKRRGNHETLETKMDRDA